MAVLLLTGGAGLLTAGASSAAAGHSHESGTSPSPHALLEAARATAARGVGPWGPVASTHLAGHGAAAPNLTFGVIMTYDAADGYVLAVSLNASAGPFNNTYGPSDLTWKFAGGNWSLITTAGQVPATLSPGLVYDGLDQYVLLYGGRLMGTTAPVAPVTNQTWSYRAGAWTNLSTSSNAAPFAVDFPNLVYDAADDYVLLYNEIGITPTNPNGYLNTTWSYAGGLWSNLTLTAGNPPEMMGAMTYDEVDQYVLYFGGYTWTNQLSNSTWSFHGGAWSNITTSVTGAPSPRINFGITYDTVHGQVLLYGGFDQFYVYNGSEFSYETWAYAGGAWTRLSTNGSIWSIQSMVYDVADNESILLGSNSSLSGPPNVVTWAYAGGSWTVAAPVFGRGGWITDVGRSITLDVSQSPNGGGLSYSYLGLPPGCSSANVRNLTCVPQTAGTYPITVTVTGAAGFLAHASATIVVNPDPTVVSFATPAPVGEVGIASTFTVSASSGTGAFAYAYVGLPPGCASSNSPIVRCVPDAPGTFVITAEVTDAAGATARGLDSFRVEPALAAAYFATDRTVLDRGQLISFAAILTGGEGPIQFTYTGLPAGCATMDAPVLSCRPAAIGSFSVGLQASDALGATAQGSASVLVNALPTVVAISASNSTIASGGSVSLTTRIAGGTAPFQFLYAGLPTGCVAPSDAVVACSSLPTGNYSVVVTVVDATGANATGAAVFKVLPAPAKVVPLPGPVEPGFWWGFALATAAIAIAVVIGGNHLRLARQGREIVRGLRAEDRGPNGTSDAEPGPLTPQAPRDR